MTAHKHRVGLVLGAGAARGWSHIGILKALAAEGIRPDIVCGCSIGALVAASSVTGHLESLEARARDMTVSRVIRYFDISLRGGGIIEGRWITDFFRESVEDIDIASVTPVFGAVATDLASGRETWLTSGSMIDAVRASIAIPGLLSPVLIRSRWHVDGALVNPLPVSLCRALGADVIIGVSLNGNLMARPSPIAVTPTPPMAPGERELADETASSWTRWFGYGRSTDAGATQQGPTADNRPGYLEVVSQTFFIVQDFVSRIRLAADPVDILIAPDVGELGWLEFHRAAEAIEAGEAAVAESLPAIRSFIDRDRLQQSEAG